MFAASLDSQITGLYTAFSLRRFRYRAKPNFAALLTFSSPRIHQMNFISPKDSSNWNIVSQQILKEMLSNCKISVAWFMLAKK
uniref:Uncharacterized protein n=1 Tax=Oryza glumipatula TaxID=40148 RepID=A0A0D9ZI04_9ORYZ